MPFFVRNLCQEVWVKIPGRLQGRALYGPIPVKTETFRELWAPLVHTFSWWKFVWTNGSESSSKVSPYTGIGSRMALPRDWVLAKIMSEQRFGKGIRRRRFQFSESSGSLNGLTSSVKCLSECLPFLSVRRCFSSLISAWSRPLLPSQLLQWLSQDFHDIALIVVADVLGAVLGNLLFSPSAASFSAIVWATTSAGCKIWGLKGVWKTSFSHVCPFPEGLNSWETQTTQAFFLGYLQIC